MRARRENEEKKGQEQKREEEKERKANRRGDNCSDCVTGAELGDR